MRRFPNLRSAMATNGLYGVADYISQPLAMLCAAPSLLHYLGAEQYALWIMASAAITGGSLLSSGFGDAAIKHISECRGRGDLAGVERMVRTTLSINLALSSLLAGVLWALTPILAQRLPLLHESLRPLYREALHLGCLLLIVKSLEGVFICVHRAHERYGLAGRLSIGVRVTVVAVTVAIAVLGGNVVTILWATLALSLAGVGLQAHAVWKSVALRSAWPMWDPATIKQISSFGCYSWLLAFVGLFTGQADRFVIGYILGTQAVVYYTISVQAAQPIHGIASAGLHVLFPHLGVRFATMTRSGIREKIKRALALNAALILVLAGTLIAGSRFLLQHWMGRDFAAHAAVPLAIISCSYALLGLNVTAHYILMAMGRMRFLALLNALAAVVMLAAMVLLAKRFGLIGAASARLIYGPITWIVYPALAKMLRSQKVLSPADGLRSAYEVP